MRTGLVFVGTYTRYGKSEGIYVFECDRKSGKLFQIALIQEQDPSWLAFSPDRRFLFAVSESKEYNGSKQGSVCSYSINWRNGDLTRLSRQGTGGGDPCHLCADPTGKFLVVSNHEDGNISLHEISTDGALSALTQLVKHSGSGPGPTQKSPHPHCVVFDPTGQRILINDKGIDKIMSYRIHNNKLIANNPPSTLLHRGAAPRHIAFHPSGRYAYVNGEADMTVTAYNYDAITGIFSELHYLSTLPHESNDKMESTAQCVVEPRGRFVYVSNRGHDTIACFAIDQANGRLISVGNFLTGGRTPRNFQIDCAGIFLYVANEGSDTIVQYIIDQSSGALVPTGNSTEVGAPVCILFS